MTGEYTGFAVPAPLNSMLAADRDRHARIRSLITAELAPRRLATLPKLDDTAQAG